MQIDVDKKAEFYKALSNPTRLNIIQILLNKNKEICICELAKELNKHSSVIFRHVESLESVNLIKTKKKGNCLMCFISNKTNVKKILEVKL